MQTNAELRAMLHELEDKYKSNVKLAKEKVLKYVNLNNNAPGKIAKARRRCSNRFNTTNRHENYGMLCITHIMCPIN